MGCNPLRRTPWVTVRLACQQVYTPWRLRVPPGAPVLTWGSVLSVRAAAVPFHQHFPCFLNHASVLHVQQHFISPWQFFNNCLQALLTRGCCRAGLRRFRRFSLTCYSFLPCSLHALSLGGFSGRGVFLIYTILVSVLLTNQQAPLPYPRLCLLFLSPFCVRQPAHISGFRGLCARLTIHPNRQNGFQAARPQQPAPPNDFFLLWSLHLSPGGRLLPWCCFHGAEGVMVYISEQDRMHVFRTAPIPQVPSGSGLYKKLYVSSKQRQLLKGSTSSFHSQPSWLLGSRSASACAPCYASLLPI